MKDEQMTKEQAKEAIIAFLQKARFLKLTNDVAFKAFFKRNKKLLISLLQSFLPFPEGVKILDAELVDAHHPPEALEDHKDMAGKQFVLDLKVKVEVIKKSGQKQIETVNVEMQTTSEPYLVDRILAYVCRVYSDQVKKGGQYSDLKRVYSLVFTTENLKIFKGISDYYHVCNIRRITQISLFAPVSY